MGTRWIIFAALTILFAAPAGADIDHIGLYAQLDATDCDEPLAEGQTVDVHVLAVLPSFGDSIGITAAEFRIDNLPPVGDDGIYTAVWSSPLTIGDITESFAIAWTEPQYGPIVHIGTISFHAITPDWVGEDHLLRVAPAIYSGYLVVVDDEFNEIPVAGSYFTFNCSVPEECECGVFDMPVCSVFPDTLDFGVLDDTDPVELDFTIANVAGGVLEGWVSETCDHYSIVEGVGAYSLLGGEVHTVTVRFEPPSVGTFDCIVDTGTEHCVDVFCRGEVALPEPICVIEPDSLDFGVIDVGDTADRLFTIENIGTGVLTGFVSETCPQYTILSGGGSFVLSQGQTRTVTVRFAPYQSGAHECTVHTGTDYCPDVYCQGVAEDIPPVCEVDPAELDFGDVAVGDYANGSFVIANSGGGLLEGEVTLDSEHFHLVGGGGPFSLGLGESWPVTVRFLPLDYGDLSATVLLGTELCDDVPCAGRGTPPAGAPDHIGLFADAEGQICETDLELYVETTLYLLAVVPSFAGSGITGAEFRVANLPEGPGGDWYVDWVLPPVEGDLANGVVLEFPAPVTGELVLLGTLSLMPLDAAWIPGPDYVVSVEPSLASGERTVRDHHLDEWEVWGNHFTFFCSDPQLCECEDFQTPACLLEPDLLDFGIVQVGDHADLSFTLSNTGYDLLEGEITIEGGAYALVAGAGPFSLAHGETLVGTVRFSPPWNYEYEGTVHTGLADCPALPCIGSGTGGSGGGTNYIGMFADEGADLCYGDIDLYVTFTTYVYAIIAPEIFGITAAEFRIDNLPEPGPGGLVTQNWAPPLVIGDPWWGIAIAFTEPQPGPLVLLGTLDFFMIDESWIGEDYWTGVSHSNESGLLVIVDDDFVTHDAMGMQFTFNCTNPSACDCIEATPVLLSLFELDDLGGRVSARWEAEGGQGAEFRLETTGGGETWSVPYEEEAPGLYSAIDDSPGLAQGGDFVYRLSGRLAGEDWQLLREESIRVSPPAYATRLLPAHPNPFNPQVTIPFTLAESGRARLSVHDVAGRRVAVLADGRLEAGPHEREWRGRDEAGRALSSGVYFVRLEAAGRLETRKLVLLR